MPLTPPLFPDLRVGIWTESLVSARSEAIASTAQSFCRQLLGVSRTQILGVSCIFVHSGVSSLSVSPLRLEDCAPSDAERNGRINSIPSDALDVLLSFDYRDSIWEWPLESMGLRGACVFDDLTPFEFNRTWEGHKAHRSYVKVARAVEAADLLLCSSAALMRKMTAMYPRAATKAHVLPLAASHGAEAGRRARPPALRAHPADSFTVLGLGGRAGRGAVEYLLAAIPCIAASVAPARLMVAAVGAAYAPSDAFSEDAITRLLNKARHSCRVSLTDRDDRVARDYWARRADVIVMPSPCADSFLLREMIATGTPLVLSDVEIHRELADVRAVYVEPYDPEEIAARISQVLLSPHSAVAASSGSVPTADWGETALRFLDIVGVHATASAGGGQTARWPAQDTQAGEESDKEHPLPAQPVLVADQDANGPLGALFDDIVAHGSLANYVAFCEYIVRPAQSSLEPGYPKLLSAMHELLRQPISCLLVAHSREGWANGLRMLEESRRTSERALLVLFDPLRHHVINNPDRHLVLGSGDALAALVLAARSTLLLDRQMQSRGPTPHDRSIERLFAWLEQFERNPPYPPAWAPVADALKLRALGFVKEVAYTDDACALALDTSVRAWADAASAEAHYRQEWQALVSFALQRRRAPTSSIVETSATVGRIVAAVIKPLTEVARLMRSLAAMNFLVAGNKARNEGRWANVATNYREYLDWMPGDSAMWVQLGHSIKEQGDFSAAHRCYAMALALDPGSADAYLHLGHALKFKGTAREAANAYFLALSKDPVLTDARNELIALGWPDQDIDGELYRRRGNAHEAPDLRAVFGKQPSFSL